METTLQPEELQIVLGANVRSRRKELKLTQQAVADAAGVAQGYIASIEAGHKSVTLGVVARIAEFLKLPPSALISAEMATLVDAAPAADPVPSP
jgi:transcriptional regulator with XRE-family HTH domain